METISREEARIRGLKHFFTGIPCKNGHISPRFVSVNNCVTCLTNKKREYRAEGRYVETEKAYAIKFRDSGRSAEFARSQYHKDPDPWRARAQEWKAQNRNWVNVYSRSRRKRLLVAAPKWVNWDEIESVYYEAIRIKLETGIPHDVDHIIPIKGENVCGLHVPWNLRVVPSTVNKRKSNKSDEYLSRSKKNERDFLCFVARSSPISREIKKRWVDDGNVLPIKYNDGEPVNE